MNRQEALEAYPDLSEADLRGADLSEADLRGADLRGADLSEADLREADLSEADLRGADLSEADLRWADLSEADLSEADLHGANLRGANLRGADLSEADLSEADLRGADLRGATGNNRDITSLQPGQDAPLVVYAKSTETLAIGCSQKPISEWVTLGMGELNKIDEGVDANELWARYGSLVCEFLAAQGAYEAMYPDAGDNG